MCVCMLVPCVTFASYAANGRISFADPSTAVGEMVDVKCVVKSTSGSLGATSVSLSYDSSALRFDSGDGVTSSGAGSLTYNGDGGSAEVSFTMTFQALTEGQTKITVSGADIKSSSGSTLTLDQGNSTVTIAEGDPSKIVQPVAQPISAGEGTEIEVNGQSYQLSGDFADLEIPVGYTRTTMAYEGAERPMVMQESSGIYLAYLINAEGTGEFFVFDDENATFFPFEQVDISDTTTIVLLSDDKMELPSNYALTTLTMNGNEFPVWQDTDKEGIYLMYAKNSNGEKGFYQYDSVENTYQKIDVSKEKKEEKVEKTGNTKLDKIQNLVDKHFKVFLIALGVIFFILILTLIIIRVKLRNRDIELDDLYDEYGIDLEDEEPQPKKGKGKDKLAVKKPSRKVKDEDNFDLYEDEDDFDDFEDDYDEGDFDEDDFGTDSYDEDDFEEEKEAPLRTVRFDDFNTITDMGLEGYDEDDFGAGGFSFDDSDNMIDDLDELLSARPKNKRSHAEKDDAFKVDFIDLD